VVHLRVVEAVQQMDRARTRGGEADADLAGELGLRARHEGRELLVARLDEFHLVVAPERAHDAVDAIAGVAVDTLNAPLREALEQEIANRLGHVLPPRRITRVVQVLYRRKANARREARVRSQRALTSPPRLRPSRCRRAPRRRR